MTRSLQKHQQKGMFPLCERNPSACAMDLSRGGIQAQILELQQGGVQSGALLNRTVQPQTQQQITGRLGGDPEIISTETQALSPGLHRVLHKIQENRHAPEARPQIRDQRRLPRSEDGGNGLLTLARCVRRHAGTQPIHRCVPGSRQPLGKTQSRRTRQENQGLHGHGSSRSGLAIWGRPQPSLLRSTWKNS